MTPICATFSDFRLVKGRKVCQLVCEVPLEQADAALAALGGIPNPHAERWVGIVALKEQPQGKLNSGSAPPPHADAADSPAAARDGGSTSAPYAAVTPQAQARGAAEPANISRSSEKTSCPQREACALNGAAEQQRKTMGVTAGETAPKPKKHWDDYSPSQQAGMACSRPDFIAWTGGVSGADATFFVRDACHVKSRSDLDTNPEAAKRWRDLYGMFQADTQYGERR